MPYYSPHTIRRTLTRLGEQLCTTPEALKSWSQNLGHDEVLTTLTSYGAVPASRQAELIASVGMAEDPLRDRIAMAVSQALQAERSTSKATAQ